MTTKRHFVLRSGLPSRSQPKGRHPPTYQPLHITNKTPQYKCEHS